MSPTPQSSIISSMSSFFRGSLPLSISRLYSCARETKPDLSTSSVWKAVNKVFSSIIPDFGRFSNISHNSSKFKLSLPEIYQHIQDSLGVKLKNVRSTITRKNFIDQSDPPFNSARAQAFFLQNKFFLKGKIKIFYFKKSV